MKKNASTIGLLIGLVSFIVAFGIYYLFLAKKNAYLVDNPTPETYYFKINGGGEKIITSGQYVKVNLEKGENRIEVFDREKELLYDSLFTVNKIRGILNITHSDYYIHRQYYGYGLNKDSLIAALPQTVIDGENYYGGAKKMDQLYNEDFYYNIDEEYDPVVKNIQKVESRVKIFRKQDFLNYYKTYYNF